MQRGWTGWFGSSHPVPPVARLGDRTVDWMMLSQRCVCRCCVFFLIFPPSCGHPICLICLLRGVPGVPHMCWTLLAKTSTSRTHLKRGTFFLSNKCTLLLDISRFDRRGSLGVLPGQGGPPGPPLPLSPETLRNKAVFLFASWPFLTKRVDIPDFLTSYTSEYLTQMKCCIQMVGRILSQYICRNTFVGILLSEYLCRNTLKGTFGIIRDSYELLWIIMISLEFLKNLRFPYDLLWFLVIS